MRIWLPTFVSANRKECQCPRLNGGGTVLWHLLWQHFFVCAFLSFPSVFHDTGSVSLQPRASMRSGLSTHASPTVTIAEGPGLVLPRHLRMQARWIPGPGGTDLEPPSRTMQVWSHCSAGWEDRIVTLYSHVPRSAALGGRGGMITAGSATRILTASAHAGACLHIWS